MEPRDYRAVFVAQKDRVRMSLPGLCLYISEQSIRNKYRLLDLNLKSYCLPGRCLVCCITCRHNLDLDLIGSSLQFLLSVTLPVVLLIVIFFLPDTLAKIKEPVPFGAILSTLDTDTVLVFFLTFLYLTLAVLPLTVRGFAFR